MSQITEVSGISSFVPYQGQTSGLGVRYCGKKNDFDEDIGEIVAINERQEVAPIDLAHLLLTLGANSNFVTTSISEKTALLEALRKRGTLQNLQVILQSDFKPLDRSINDSAELVDRVFFTRASSSLLRSSAEESPLSVFAMRLVLDEARLFATPGRDVKIGYELYDRIASLFSYSTSGGAALDRDSYFQMIPNGIPLSLTSYQTNPPITPLNPQGDIRTTEEFSHLASFAFDPSGRLDDKKNVENAFKTIVEGANSSQLIDENALAVLERVRSYLKIKQKDPFTGEEFETDSPQYAAFKKANNKYQLALVAYIGKKNQYDLSKPEDQEKWQVDSIMLQMKINEARDELDTFTTVKRALEYLKVYGNNAVQNALASAKDAYGRGTLSSQVNHGERFHVSYGFPANWFSDDSGFTSVSISTKDFSSEYSREATSYSGGATYHSGLFSVGGSFSSSRDEVREHLEASDFNFEFDVATIAIQRPWMDSTFLGLEAWNLGGLRAGAISKGIFPAKDPHLGARLLPYYATAFVIAKNIKVKGAWSESDLRVLRKSLQGSTSVNCGPFRLGGASYSKSSVERAFNATENNGTFTVPGAQIIGVINTVVPFAAPDHG